MKVSHTYLLWLAGTRSGRMMSPGLAALCGHVEFCSDGRWTKRIQGIGSGCFLPCGKGCDKVFNNLCEYLIPLDCGGWRWKR